MPSSAEQAQNTPKQGSKAGICPIEIRSESAGFDAGILAYSYCLLLELDGTINLSNIIQLYSENCPIQRFDVGLTWQGLVRPEGFFDISKFVNER